MRISDSRELIWRVLPTALSYVLLQAALRFKDDGKIAKRLKAKDPRVMSTLYERYGRLVYSLIFRGQSFIWHIMKGFPKRRSQTG